MLDQYFGHKELYDVVLRAKFPMRFGSREIEAQEPVLYFDNVNMTTLNEPNRPIMARGGWGNLPRVVWDDRQEVTFSMTEGVMSNVGFGILLSANVLTPSKDEVLYVHKKDGPLTLVNDRLTLTHIPAPEEKKKIFVFEYDRKAIQDKFYYEREETEDPFGQPVCKLRIGKDKNFTIPAENNRNYLVDYYYEYRDEALIYSMGEERFNGFFSLEAKFYSKDENEGMNYTNVLYMPKVRVVSNINLRLGERADPMVSGFSLLGLPEPLGDRKNVIMEITRLSKDIDADI